MQWKNEIEKPIHGDLKVVTKFAWWPKQVGNKKVWLEKYSQLYEWIVRRRAFPYFRGMINPCYGTFGEWELKSERSKKSKKHSNVK